MTTTTPPIAEIRELDTAEDLFRELSPATGSIWDRRSVESDWLFRGHSNNADGTLWTLTPAAMRPGAFLKYMMAMIEERPPMNGLEQRERELRAALDFAARVDREGLVVPGDSPELRDERVAPLDDVLLDHRRFPPVHLTAIFALAQHHGVPTRLLDWTWKPLVAAYFAVEGVARRRVPGVKPPMDAPFSIIALRHHIFTQHMRWNLASPS